MLVHLTLQAECEQQVEKNKLLVADMEEVCHRVIWTSSVATCSALAVSQGIGANNNDPVLQRTFLTSPIH